MVYHGTMVYHGYTMVYHGIPCLHYGIAEELIHLKYTITPFGYQAILSSVKQAVTDQYYAWFHYFVYCIDRQHCFYKLLLYFIRGLTRVVLFIRLFRPIFLLYSEIIIQHSLLFSKIQFIHNTVYFCFVKPDIFLARSLSSCLQFLAEIRSR